MGKNRKSNHELPRRVYLQHGAYRFMPSVAMIDPKDGKVKKCIHLAYQREGLAAMSRAYDRLLATKVPEAPNAPKAGSMAYLCAQFKKDKLPTYKLEPDTESQYCQYLDTIAEAFKEFQVSQVTTMDCDIFLHDYFGSESKMNTAEKYVRLLRRLFKHAISKYGYRKDNPINDLDDEMYTSGRRMDAPTHAQILRIRQASLHSTPRSDNGRQYPTRTGPMFCCIVDMTYLCWARAKDIRLLKETDIDGGWIHFRPAKTKKSSGKKVDIFITPEIRAVIEKARWIKKNMYQVESDYLFTTTSGMPYSKSGLFGLWDNARARAGITDDIQFRDLRSLGATDAAVLLDEQLEEIRKGMAHTSVKATMGYIKTQVTEKSAIRLPLPW